MQLAFTLFAVLLAFLDSAHSTDYCNPDLCRNGKHTGCNNDGKFGADCVNPREIQFTPVQKDSLIQMHNEKRNTVAGGDTKLKPACRMATMDWDEELASLALLHAKRCEINHDPCRNTDTFLHSGQNIAWMNFHGTPNITIMSKRSIDLWFNEIMDTEQAFVDKYPRGYNGPPIGHFTVMMADRNIRLGCGAVIYKEQGDNFEGFLLICNYATTNVIDFPIYESCTEPATKCKSGKNTVFHNLCASSETYDVNNFQ